MKKLTKKHKQKLLNILMVLIIAVCIVGGIFFVAFQKGWFNKNATQPSDNNAQHTITVTTIRGEVAILRNGISFYPENDDVLMANDVLSTRNQSTCELRFDSNFVYVNAQTKLKLSNINRGALEFDLLEGDLVADIDNDSPVTFNAGEKQFTTTIKYFSLNSDGDYSEDFSTSSEADDKDDKKEDKHKYSADDKKNNKKSNKKNGKDNKNKPDNKKDVDSEKQPQNNKPKKDGSNKNDNNKKPDKSDKKPTKPAKPVATPTPDNICTISIYCNKVLDNMDKLAEGKDKFVPANGCILKKTEITFEKGETAFDVLKKACESNNIPLEYSWTPGLDSYYVEGINHLYEFDCGDTSGWLYDVNGERPIRGSSYYEVVGGDNFVWHYTLTLGSKPS